jgi:hypothetical protein
MSVSQSRTAHFAHLGGMLFGLVYVKWDDWRKSASGWKMEKKRQQHLKVVWDRDREKQKLREEIDNLLDKAGKNGVNSLTAEEHERFKILSKKLTDLESRD